MTTRERMIVSAALLVREQGARATSIDDVLQHSGAPRGSVYHHFPGGRDELLREATAYAGRFVARALEHGAATDPHAALDAFLDGYRAALVDGDFRPGCPVAAVAVEAPAAGAEDTALLDAAAGAFAAWEAQLAAHYRAAGASEDAAAGLATVVLASVEGALILCQARREIAPLDVVRRTLHLLIDQAIGQEQP